MAAGIRRLTNLKLTTLPTNKNMFHKDIFFSIVVENSPKVYKNIFTLCIAWYKGCHGGVRNSVENTTSVQS